MALNLVRALGVYKGLWTRAFHYIHEHPHTGTRHLGTNKQTKEEKLSELNSSLDVKYRAVHLSVSWNYFNDHSRGEFRRLI